MSSYIDHKAVDVFLQGQGCANKLKTLYDNGERDPAVIKRLINTIVDSYSVVRSSFVDSPNPPLHHESSFQSMASLVPKSKIYGAKEFKYSRDDTPAPPSDDGFIWKQHGQKIIKNFPHKRLYYHCVCSEKCKATKQVQKINDYPPVYRTTYWGEHQCETAAFTINDDTYGSKMIQFGQTVSESVMPQLATVNVNQALTMKDKDTNHIINMEEVFEVDKFMNYDDWQLDYPMQFDSNSFQV